MATRAVELDELQENSLLQASAHLDDALTSVRAATQHLVDARFGGVHTRAIIRMRILTKHLERVAAPVHVAARRIQGVL